MTTYLEAEANPTRNTGAIRLYDEAAFAGMPLPAITFT